MIPNYPSTTGPRSLNSAWCVCFFSSSLTLASATYHSRLPVPSLPGVPTIHTQRVWLRPTPQFPSALQSDWFWPCFAAPAMPPTTHTLSLSGLCHHLCSSFALQLSSPLTLNPKIQPGLHHILSPNLTGFDPYPPSRFYVTRKGNSLSNLHSLKVISFRLLLQMYSPYCLKCM